MIGEIRNALYVAPSTDANFDQEFDVFEHALRGIDVKLDYERHVSLPQSLSMFMGKDSYEETLSLIEQYEMIIANISTPSEYVGQRAQVSSSLGRMLVTSYDQLNTASRMVLGASNLRLPSGSSQSNAELLANYIINNAKRPLTTVREARQRILSELDNVDPLEFALQKAKPLAYVAFPITCVSSDEKERIRQLVRRIGYLLSSLNIDVHDLEHKLTDPGTERGRNASISHIYDRNRADIVQADFVILLTSERYGSTGVGMEHALAAYDGKPQIHIGSINSRLVPIFPTKWISQHINNGNDESNFKALEGLLRDYRQVPTIPVRWEFARLLEKAIRVSGKSHRDLARILELRYGEPPMGLSVSNLSKLVNPEKYGANIPPLDSVEKLCEIFREEKLDSQLIDEILEAAKQPK